jgi:FimV-like protein
VRIKPGTGITLTSRFTVMAKDEPLEDVLDKLLKQREWGYYVVVAKPGDQDDGAIMLVTDPVRGYPPDDPRSGKSDEKGKKDTAKEKKDVAKSKTDEPKKGAATNEEKTASNRLDFAENYIAGGKPEKAKPILKEIVEKYPNTKAAEEAKKLLEKLDK